MYSATHANVEGADIFIGAAAVSDYRPARPRLQKIKKHDETMHIELVRTDDILASVAGLEVRPFTVGFAAETENVRDYAMSKLEKKGLDMIVANRVGDDCGFDRDENAAQVYWRGGERDFPTASKTELADGIVQLVAEHYAAARDDSTQPELAVFRSRE
jgi:phosphopantothenoylcysteine decarboxylase/phosphopantothenate--cysteine ligase